MQATCQNCGNRDADDMDGMCPACGQSVFQIVSDALTPTSSSGRLRVPASRAYLERLNDQGRPLPEEARDGFLSDLADAEELVSQCDRDVQDRMAEMQYARHVIDSEHLGERELDPETRHQYVEFLGAEGRWEAAVQAAERARRRYHRLAERFDEIANPSRLSYPPGWFGE